MIDRFELLRTVGYGGMGVVFEAYDPRLRRKVALKLWSDKRLTETGPKLLGEAWALARLMHPNVTAVYELGEYDGHPYLVMEYVPGLDAHSWFAACWQEAVNVYIQAGRGLAAAHAVGLLHNDVKPSNILISDTGQVKLTDFGLASSMPREDKDPDKPIGGTPLYMAPEFNREAASDQFSLCASLYQALYGVPPYVGKNRLHLMFLIEQGGPQIGVALPDIPERVRAAVHKGIAVNPAARHESVTALVVELEQCLAEDSETARAESSRGEAATSKRRADRQGEPKSRGLRNLGPTAIALLLFAGSLLGMVATLGAQGTTTRSRASEIDLRARLHVRMLTQMAQRTARRGDGKTALSMLAAAQERARTLDEECFVAEKADDVGMRLYEAQQWQQATAAHEIAAVIYGERGLRREYTRSLGLAHMSDAGWKEDTP